MLSIIRRALDARRLTADLEAAERRVAYLEEEIRCSPNGPLFEKVATDFDATQLIGELKQHVLDEIGPMLNEHALRHLQAVMRNIEHDRVEGRVAFDCRTRTYLFRFEAFMAGTEVRIPHIPTRPQRVGSAALPAEVAFD